MFRDEEAKYWWGRYRGELNLFLGVFLGWCLSVGASEYESCPRIATQCFLLPGLVVCSLLVLQVVRDRSSSLHHRHILYCQLTCLLLYLALSLALGVEAGLALRLLANRTHACSNQAESINSTSFITPTVSSDLLLATTAILAAFSLCLMVSAVLRFLYLVYFRMVFMKPVPTDYGSMQYSVTYVKSDGGVCIPMIVFLHPDPRATIIYCHGNAVDLGLLLEKTKLQGIRDELEVNVIGFDYTGYGEATGGHGCSEAGVYDSLLAVYEAAVFVYNIPRSSIILWGRSLGTCASIHLASKLQPGQLAGVVLESPPLSMISTKLPAGISRALTRWDMFRSVEKIAQISCPTFFVHGKADRTVPFSHGEQLFSLARFPFQPPLWLEECGHNDLPELWQYCAPERRLGEADEAFEKRLDRCTKLNGLNLAFRSSILRFIEHCRREGKVGRHDFHVRQEISQDDSPVGKPKLPITLQTPNSGRSRRA
jgi:fermentation-respiration switch protein FrsA (DUF1100 family)